MISLDIIQQFSNLRAQLMNDVDFKAMAQLELAFAEEGMDIAEIENTPPTVPLADHLTYRGGFYL